MWKELENKSIAVWDTETNGLLRDVTEMHCSTIINARTKEVHSTTNAESLLTELDKFDILVGHNIIGFDLKLLKNMFGWEPRANVIILDTLWMSRMYHPDLDGGHSLGSWGVRLGNPKTEYYPILDPDQPHYDPMANVKKDPGWTGSIYTKMMGGYCEQDVSVNVDLFWKLCILLKNFSWNSIICEMETAVLIQRQMEHGFVFDMHGAEILHSLFVQRIIELEDIVLDSFKPLPKLVREVQPKVKQDGTVSSVGLKKLGDDWETLVPVPEWDPWDSTGTVKGPHYTSGSFSLIEFPEFSLGSRQQIAERLTRAGYKLTKFTEKGNSIIDDVVLQEAAEAGILEAVPLAEYFLIQKREAMVKDWISKAVWDEKQGVWRIYGYVNSMGANSHRMTHSSPNIAQVPASHSPYGKECRSLFGVRKGYKLVGCDASGLELRMLATYMKDKEYSDAVVNGVKEEGTDIHTVNMRAAGLSSRDQAKTMVYALLYGAGDAKLGKIVGGASKEGKLLKDKFYKAIPSMGKLAERVKIAAKNKGWLRGLDGRILRVRSPHSALNTLLQGGGAIVMKYFLIEVARVADGEKLEWYPSANVHDEIQCEVKEEHVPRFKEICEQAFKTISKELELFCELEGEAVDGDTWQETH